jgi:hypothetical protein
VNQNNQNTKPFSTPKAKKDIQDILSKYNHNEDFKIIGIQFQEGNIDDPVLICQVNLHFKMKASEITQDNVPGLGKYLQSISNTMVDDGFLGIVFKGINEQGLIKLAS